MISKVRRIQHEVTHRIAGRARNVNGKVGLTDIWLQTRDMLICARGRKMGAVTQHGLRIGSRWFSAMLSSYMTGRETALRLYPVMKGVLAQCYQFKLMVRGTTVCMYPVPIRHWGVLHEAGDHASACACVLEEGGRVLCCSLLWRRSNKCSTCCQSENFRWC